MKLNKTQAAKAAGVTRPTLDKHIKEGRLSTDKNGRGQIVIDVSELERVYDGFSIDKMQNNVKALQPNTIDFTAHNAVIDVKDQLIHQLEHQLQETEKRLEAAETERRRTTEQMTNLLTDQRDRSGEVEKLKTELEAEKGRGWWSRLLGQK
ncbi:MAG: hypothetical protein GY927_00915 [bacterium]|nr:hypothetical protein [bacterium]